MTLIGAVGRALFLRTTMSTTLRNAAAWLSIIVVLVAGYSFRDEIQHVGHRVTLGLVPGSAVTRLGDDGTAEVSVGRDRSGHFTVEALVEGVPVRFLVDTGATSIALTYDDARRVGLAPETLSFSLPISTANGIGRAALTRVDTVTLGGIERRRLEATVAQRGALSQSLLGMNFVGTLASFEIRGERLILRD